MKAILSILRRPKVVAGEIAVIAVMAAMATIIPQADSLPDGGSASVLLSGWRTSPLFRFLALDHIFRSVWFAAATALAAASLLLAVIDQFRRLRSAWTRPLDEAAFFRAAFQIAFERPAPVESPGPNGPASVRFQSRHRMGLAGPWIFHVGLLLVILAGSLHALFGVHAVADLIETETLPATPAAWNRQWPGVLARPFQTGTPLKLDQIDFDLYEAGDLRDLRIRIVPDGNAKPGPSGELAINQDMHINGNRIYLDSAFGPAPLVEWMVTNDPAVRLAPLLRAKGRFMYEESSRFSSDIKAHWRVRLPRKGGRPDRVEVRIMKGPALLFAGIVRADETVKIAEGMELRLHGMPFWCRLHGSRDPGVWIVYLGFLLVVIGATIMFAIVKVDTCVRIERMGNKEKVRIALKAQRFAPLFEDQFQRLVRAEGGPL